MDRNRRNERLASVTTALIIGCSVIGLGTVLARTDDRPQTPVGGSPAAHAHHAPPVAPATDGPSVVGPGDEPTPADTHVEPPPTVPATTTTSMLPRTEGTAPTTVTTAAAPPTSSLLRAERGDVAVVPDRSATSR